MGKLLFDITAKKKPESVIKYSNCYIIRHDLKSEAMNATKIRIEKAGAFFSEVEGFEGCL